MRFANHRDSPVGNIVASGTTQVYAYAATSRYTVVVRFGLWSGWGFGIGIAMTACMDPSGVLLGVLPDRTDGDRVFAVEALDGTWTIDVFAADAPIEIFRLYDPSEDRRLVLLDYPASATPLPSGRLMPATETCGRFALPTPSVLHEWSLDDDEDWRSIDALPESLAAFRYAGACPCWIFDTNAFELEDSGLGSVAASADRLYAARLTARKVYRVFRDRLEPVSLGEEEEGASFPMRSMTGDREGGLYFGGRDGRLAHLNAAGQWQELSGTSSTAGALRAIGYASDVLYAHATNGSLWRRAGQDWSMITSPVPSVLAEVRPNVDVLRPDRAVVSIEGRDALIFIDPSEDERPIKVTVDSASIAGRGVTSFAWTEGFGLMVSTRGRQLFRREGVSWREMVVNAGSIWTIVPWRNGFMTMGNRGLFSEYLPGTEGCPNEVREPTMSWREGAVVGDTIALAGALQDGIPNTEPSKILVLWPLR